MTDVALVCGGNGALGTAIVQALLARGDQVVSADLHQHDGTTPGLRQEALDLTAPDQVAALWDRLDAAGAKPRWVVNATGGFRSGTIADSEPDTVRFVDDLNLGTAWWSCHEAARRLPEGGAIVNVSSRAAVAGGAGAAAYAVSKAAVVRMTEVLAAELAEKRVRVNAILPSVIDTPANRESMRPEQLRNAVAPADLASVVAFLLSDGCGRGDRGDRPGLRLRVSLEGLPALELLYEPAGLPAFELPDELAALYGGTLGFEEPQLIANFVASIDGVVAVPSVKGSNKLISGDSPSDRFLMGLLRASADSILIGSGTLSASPASVWTPEQVCPAAAGQFAELRTRLGRPARLEVVVLSASGLIDPAHPSFEAGAVVLTTDDGAATLAGRLPAAATVVSLGPGRELDPHAIVSALHERGHQLILSEGGPHALGPLLAAGVVDELFLTVSPLLVGRISGDPRLGLVEGADLLAAGPVDARVLGVRREGEHLFLRYALDRP